MFPGSTAATGGKAQPGQSSSPTERLFQEICSSFFLAEELYDYRKNMRFL